MEYFWIMSTSYRNNHNLARQLKFLFIIICLPAIFAPILWYVYVFMQTTGIY